VLFGWLVDLMSEAVGDSLIYRFGGTRWMGHMGDVMAGEQFG
jgi:hypothetical protein